MSQIPVYSGMLVQSEIINLCLRQNHKLWGLTLYIYLENQLVVHVIKVTYFINKICHHVRIKTNILRVQDAQLRKTSPLNVEIL